MYIFTYIHTYIQTDRQTDRHAHIHRHIRTHIHTDIHTHMHTHIHTHMRTYIHMQRLSLKIQGRHPSALGKKLHSDSAASWTATWTPNVGDIVAFELCFRGFGQFLSGALGRVLSFGPKYPHSPNTPCLEPQKMPAMRVAVLIVLLGDP